MHHLVDGSSEQYTAYGVLRDADGNIVYRGQFDNGQCALKQLDGKRIYKGPVENGEPCGSGTITYVDGGVETGVADANRNILNGKPFFHGDGADPGYQKGTLYFAAKHGLTHFASAPIIVYHAAARGP